MEYQKIRNLLGNTPSQLSKFKTKYWLERSDDLHGSYNTNSQIKFQTFMPRSRLCDYRDAYVLVRGIIIVAALVARAGDNKAFKHFGPFAK